MRRLAGVVGVAVVAVGGVASAQPSTVPSTLDPSATPRPLSQPSVMDHRWSVAGGIGWESLKVETDTKDGDKVTFGVIDLAARFRIKREVELGLGLIAGGADRMKTGGLFIDGRYRFLAEKPWNLYLGIGLGVQSVAARDAPKDERKGRGALRVAFGLERRYARLALFGEVRVVGVAGNKELAEPAAPPITWQFAKYGLSGGHVTFGATYYF